MSRFYVASAGKNITGTVYCVAAVNLGGLVGSFTGLNICRFCLRHHSEYPLKILLWSVQGKNVYVQIVLFMFPVVAHALFKDLCFSLRS